MDDVTARAFALIEQIDRDQAEQRGVFAPPRAENLTEFASPPELQPEDFIGKTVATMTTHEFSRWCDLGKPPLVKAPEPEPQPEPAQPDESHPIADQRRYA